MKGGRSWNQALSQRIEAVERRLETLAAQQGETAEISPLFAILKELQCAAEELRRQSEEAHQAQALLYSLIEVMPIGVVICSAAGTVLMTNANGEDILGAEIPGTARYPEPTYTPYRLNGSSFLAEEMPLRRALEDGEVIRDVEMVIRHPAGEERIILASAAPIRDETGHIVSGVTVFQDITERERAREVLQRYTDRLRVLHESDQAILAARSAEEIAESSLRHLLQLLDCVQASVLAFDLEANEVTFLAAHSKGETRLDRGWRGPIETDWLWMVEKLAQGQPYMVEDLQDAPASSPMVETLQTEGVQARVYMLHAPRGAGDAHRLPQPGNGQSRPSDHGRDRDGA